MRKFTKICLIIVLVLGIAGGVFFVTGVAMGASLETVRASAEGWARTHDGGHGWFGWNDDSDDDDSDDDEEWSDLEDIKDGPNEKPYKELEYPADQVLELDVEAERAYVSLTENTSDNKIRVKVYSSRDEVEFDRDDACLSVERKAKNRILEKSPIQIEIPSGKHFDDASVYVGAGVLELDGIEATELSLGVGGGELTAAGKVKGKNTELDCGMGNMEIIYLDSEYTEIDCGMGSVTAALTGSRDQYRVSLDCGLGSVNLGDESHSGISSLTTGPSSAPRKLDIECGMGEVDIAFNE